jgi:hypothetical protein
LVVPFVLIVDFLAGVALVAEVFFAGVFFVLFIWVFLLFVFVLFMINPFPQILAALKARDLLGCNLESLQCVRSPEITLSKAIINFFRKVKGYPEGHTKP